MTVSIHTMLVRRLKQFHPDWYQVLMKEITARPRDLITAKIKAGRPTIGEKRMTQTERTRRYRAKKRLRSNT